ncbi:MAG: hypothetical protein JXR76_24620 [Deltaproteobacteria bacterium]|nr:hypothetical protein [Deltaproteobacteria bacterium]
MNYNLEKAYQLHVKPAPDGGVFFTVVFKENASLSSVASSYAHVARLLKSADFAVVQERIFGRLNVREEVLQIRNNALQEELQPTYLEGTPVFRAPLAGMLLRAAPSNIVSPLILDGQVVGKEWMSKKTRFAILGGVTGEGDTPAEETRSLLLRAFCIFSEAGFVPTDIARTWFYLDDILSWYDAFNHARSGIFKSWGLMPTESSCELLLPASTGIGVRNGFDQTVTADMLLVQSAQPHNLVQQLTNPGQKDAFQYGSAFSRGAVIGSAEHRLLELSGTASINERGETIHVNDPNAQIECTLEKIGQLLSLENASLTQLSGGVAFCKDPSLAMPLQQSLKYRKIEMETFPLICVEADVCRDDLLFELDGELVID